MREVLVLKAGETSARVRVSAGDYDRWFVAAAHGLDVRFTTVQTHLGEPPPPLGRFQGVVMTGSPQSATRLTPWMLRAADTLREVHRRQIPLLGVCFGHQLLAAAFGGKVRRHPRGREIGTAWVTVEPSAQPDPLFRGLPPQFAVQTTHEDDVAELPPEAVLLAENAHSPVQAFALGATTRAVQFHPEVDAALMSAMVRARASSLGWARAAAVLSGIRPAPHGRQVLRNFLTGF